MRRSRRLLALALMLTGCATLPLNYSKMSADQLNALVKDKNANIGCATVQTPYKGNVLYLVLDKGVVQAGSVTIKSDCEVTITNAPETKTLPDR